MSRKVIRLVVPEMVSRATWPIRYVSWSFPNTPPAKNKEHLISTIETLIFGILICWKWLGTNHKHVLWHWYNSRELHYGRNVQLAMSEIKDAQQNLQECIIFNASLKISHNFQGISLHCESIGILYMSMIRFWHHAKLAASHQMIICALKQNGRKVRLKMQYCVIPISANISS